MLNRCELGMHKGCRSFRSFKSAFQRLCFVPHNGQHEIERHLTTGLSRFDISEAALIASTFRTTIWIAAHARLERAASLFWRIVYSVPHYGHLSASAFLPSLYGRDADLEGVLFGRRIAKVPYRFTQLSEASPLPAGLSPGANEGVIALVFPQVVPYQSDRRRFSSGGILADETHRPVGTSFASTA